MRTRGFLATMALSASAVFACNTFLGNDQGQLADTDASSSASPDAPGGSQDDAGYAVDGADASSAPADGATEGGGCDLGRKRCDGQCVTVSDPLYGCTETSCTPCGLLRASAICGPDRCVVGQCNAGYADCNMNPSDGCETDLSMASHCGSCNAVCQPAAPDCAPTGGGGFSCTTGCTAIAPVLCGTQCADLQTSTSHCGDCSIVCPAVTNGMPTCTGGSCGFTCDTNFHACSGACASNASPNSCGSSCTPCPAPSNSTATCGAGTCGFACNGGYHVCGGACANSSDPATCGASCTACASGPNSTASCNAMMCGLLCSSGFGDCNGIATDGCEVNVTNDPKNCGGCGHACMPGQTCVTSACQWPPEASTDMGTSG